MQTLTDEGRKKRELIKVRVIRSLERVMRERNGSKEVYKDLRNSIFLPALKYGSKTWAWNRAQTVKSACCGNEMSERGMWSENESTECI